MSLPIPPSISQGEIALDPVNGIVWYLNDAGTPVATTWSWLRKDLSVIETDDKVEITGDVDITGNLYVEGSTITVDAESVVIKDNFIVVNSTNGAATSSTAGLEVERGTSTNVQIRWNESIDKWQFTNDGTTFLDLNSITENSIALGFHTTGDYTKNLVAGTGVTISNNSGEGATPNIAIDTSIVQTRVANITDTEIGYLDGVTSAIQTQLDSKQPNFTGYDHEIHVSQVDGNDTTGNGDLLTPVASITKALTLVASQRKTVVIHPGTYTESPSITTQYTTLTGPGLIGGNIVISGTVSTNTGCTISGIKMTNLTVSTPTGQGNVNILNCEVSGTFTKSSNADYTVLRLCDFGAASITGAGLTAIFGGNPNFVTVNNASANVIVKSAVTVAPVLTAGTLSIVDCVVGAAVTNAVTSSASSVITLANSQFLTSNLSGVAPVVLNGFYSILNCIYDKPSSTLVASSGTGGTANAIDYFQYINADKFITQGGTASQFVKGDGSLSSIGALDDLTDVAITDAANGDFLRYNGSNWINDPVNLTTDTVGDYVKNLVAGNGITITNNSGEGATPNISFSGSINDLSDLTITSAQNGQILEYDGTDWVNAVRPSSEPMGFENANDSNITFSNSTRQFTISPVSSSFTIWSVGKRYIKTTSESISLPNLSNLYYIYYNTSGALAYKTTFFTLSEDTPVAYVYWNQTDAVAHFVADERHGITLDWATHEYLHRTRGAAIADGFGANNYTTSGNGSLDSHAQIDIAEGTFFDEDLRIVITNSATPSVYSHQQTLQGGGEFPVFYRTDSHYRRDTATKFPMKIGSSRVTYNLFSGGLWSTPDIDNNKFGISYLVATNDLNDPIFAMMGQDQYTDQGSAEEASWDSMDVADFPVAEFRLLYKLIYQAANAYTNTPKARLTGVQDLRVSFISGGNLATVPVSDHGTMTGLSDDDHTQYLNQSRHDALDHSTAMNTVALDDIGNVNAATPSSDQVLTWDSGSSTWINKTFSASVTTLDAVGDVNAPSPSSGDFIKWNGTAWINDSIDLGTDTTGNYMSNISGGTGIDVSHTQGEGSTATVSVSSIVIKTTDTGTVTADMLATGPAKAGFKYVINEITSGGLTSNNYNLISSDLAKLITIDNGSTNASVTIPLSFLSQGDRIDILNKGTGILSIKIASGGSLYCTPQATANEAKLRSQWSSATIVKLDSSNTWLVIGDLQA